MSSFVPEICEFLATASAIPTLPDAVLRLHAALDDENVHERAIVRIVESDPSLTARLLRLANSAKYMRADGTVGSVGGAVRRLGLRQVHTASMALSVVRMFGGGRGLDHRAFWRHAVAVGLAAQRLGRSRGWPGAGDLYVAGLLHDIGILVLEQYFPAQFGQVTEAARDRPLWHLEAEILGMDHGEIGALLLGRWSLPQDVTAAVGAHHHPQDHGGLWMAEVVHAAEVVCSDACVGLAIEGPLDIEAAALERVREMATASDGTGIDAETVAREVDTVFAAA
jgi:HD-like signal output (HDOD) protein